MNTQDLMPQMSDKFDIILKNLMAAKAEIGRAVKKDSTNPFHKSKYASIGAHLEASEESLRSHGLIMLQTVNGSHKEAVLIATLCHAESGQWIKSYMPLPNPKGDSQGLGAAITYMRRYSISSMLGLAAEDDDGESACIRKKDIEPKKHKLDTDKIQTLQRLNDQLDGTCRKKMNNWLVSTYNTTSYADLPPDCFQKVLVTYENAVKFLKSEKVEVVQYA